MSDSHPSKWWAHLKKSPGLDKQLQRCGRDPRAAFLQPAFGTVLQFFDPDKQVPTGILLRLAAAAVVTSHIRENDSRVSFAEQAAKAGIRPAVFHGLVNKDDPMKMALSLIHIVQQMGRKANVDDLFNSLRFWDRATQERWCLSYYPNSKEQ